MSGGLHAAGRGAFGWLQAIFLALFLWFISVFRLFANGRSSVRQQFLPRRHVDRAANRMLAALGLPPLPVFILDCGVLADRVIVPTIPEFEYHRSDLPARTETSD